MGMFDRVWVRCDCGNRVEFQSKAGDCCLRDYTLDDVPARIAADLIGNSERCQKCGATITISGAVTLMREVTK